MLLVASPSAHETFSVSVLYISLGICESSISPISFIPFAGSFSSPPPAFSSPAIAAPDPNFRAVNKSFEASKFVSLVRIEILYFSSAGHG